MIIGSGPIGIRLEEIDELSEAIRPVGVGGVEHLLAFLAHDVGEAVVDVGWGVEADTRVAVFVV